MSSLEKNQYSLYLHNYIKPILKSEEVIDKIQIELHLPVRLFSHYWEA